MARKKYIRVAEKRLEALKRSLDSRGVLSNEELGLAVVDLVDIFLLLVKGDS